MRSDTKLRGDGSTKSAAIGILSAVAWMMLGWTCASSSASAADTATATGRRYEQVMPATKAFPFGQVNSKIAVASVDGGAVAFQSFGPMPGSSSGSQENFNVARRTTDGWVNTPIAAPQETLPGRPNYPETQGFSTDLSHVAFKSSNPPLTPEAALDVTNLYVRDTRTGAYTLISTVGGSLGVSPFLTFGGASDDFKHVAFEAFEPLLPGAPGVFSPSLYEWVNGQIRNVGIYSDATPAPIAALGQGALSINRVTNAVSDDGHRIVFWDGVGVYIRTDGASTTHVTASQRTTPDPHGAGGTFWAASADARKVFFTSSNELTDDANTGDDGSGNPTDAGRDLYLYDLTTGDLTDLSIDANPADISVGADVQGVIGASDDGEYVYFVAHGGMAPEATSGANNLYVSHGGRTTYIGALDSADAAAWTPTQSATSGQAGVTARVTPDGRHMAIQSVARLTGYDNVDPSSGTPSSQVYRYAADQDSLSCVSCRPDGRPPSGSATITPPDFIANTPRNITDDGRRVFFDSTDALVTGDTNGRTDVYEWANGTVALVSDGRRSFDAAFQDASASGDDVFFATGARLVPTDVDDHYELYDARIGGGFPVPPDDVPASCDGDACQGAPSSRPSVPTAASVSFTGPGNDAAGQSAGLLASVKATKPKSVAGTSAVLRIEVPGQGRLTISGAGLGPVTRSPTGPGTLNVRVSLTARSRASLRKHRRLQVTARVIFKPSGRASSSAKVVLTFTQAKASKKGRS
jgi:hypothetical protein